MTTIDSGKIEYSRLSPGHIHIGELASLYYAEWGHEVPDRTLDAELHALQSSVANEAFPVTLVASYRGELVGAGQLKWREMSIFPDRDYWLGGIIVKPEYRGQGIARELILRLVDSAKALAIDRLFLQTEQLDGGLYRKLGWRGLEIVNHHHIHVLVMERIL